MPVSVPGPVGASAVDVWLGRAGGGVVLTGVVLTGVLVGVAFAGRTTFEADGDGLALAEVTAALAAGAERVTAGEAGGEMGAAVEAAADTALDVGNVASTPAWSCVAEHPAMPSGIAKATAASAPARGPTLGGNALRRALPCCTIATEQRGRKRSDTGAMLTRRAVEARGTGAGSRTP